MNNLEKKTSAVNYKPGGPILKAFHESNAFVRGIMGPIGSGKSTACIIELIRKAGQQRPSPDGIRRTRFAVIRNSYPELKSTTLKSWFQWCPTPCGKVNMDSPIIHHIKEGDIDMEVLFMALDREEDAKKLLSLELTGAFINEAREVPKGIVDALTGRVGRYPPVNQGGCTWSGILLDTNPPDDQSWWYKYSEEETPNEWSFFKQPSGDGPNAENIPNLPKNYYQRIKAGKDEDWIKVYVRGEYGFVTEGKSVFPMFRDSIHSADGSIEPIQEISLSIGVDFGLTPCAIIGQKLVDGRWLILDEVITENCGTVRFAERLSSYMAKNYPDHLVQGCWGDPAGNQRAHSDERTALGIMNQYSGWKWKPAPTNDITMRREVVTSTLNRMVDGKPGILISNKAATLRKGFAGGYHFKFVKSANGSRVHETPAKNQYSHPHDALQYLLLGGGEANIVMNRMNRINRGNKPRIARGTDYSIFNYNNESDY